MLLKHICILALVLNYVHELAWRIGNTPETESTALEKLIWGQILNMGGAKGKVTHYILRIFHLSGYASRSETQTVERPREKMGE